MRILREFAGGRIEQPEFRILCSHHRPPSQPITPVTSTGREEVINSPCRSVKYLGYLLTHSLRHAVKSSELQITFSS